MGAALAERLAEPEGPEVVLVLPRDQGGWLEASSMGVLRERLLAYLRSQRYVRAPSRVVPGGPAPARRAVSRRPFQGARRRRRFRQSGSANLSNRSMRLDTECDLAIATNDDAPGETSKAIAAFRTRLLSEHLGVDPSAFDARFEQSGSLIRAVESFEGGERSLVRLAPGPEPAVHLAVFDGLDVRSRAADCPGKADRESSFLRSCASPRRGRSRATRLCSSRRWQLAPPGGSLLFVIFSPSSRWSRSGGRCARVPLAPLYVGATYLVGGLLFFPITLLITGTTLVFDPFQGFVYSMLGTLASASMTYGVGRLVGRPLVERLLTPRLHRFRTELRRRSFVAILVARLMPVGNFSLIDLLAGALQVAFGQYLLANAIGILPGVLGFTLFASRIGQTLLHPGLENVVILLATLAVVVAALWLLQRGLRRARRSILASRREAKES